MTIKHRWNEPPASSGRDRRDRADGGPRRHRGRLRPRDVTIRQGYQTNIWGMPTYYLMKSGYLEKRGSRPRTSRCRPATSPCSRWWRGRSTWAPMPGPSFIIGHDKGGLVAIAQIETVGATGAMVVRKDLGITKIDGPQGQEDRQPDRLLDRQHLRRSGRPGERPEEGRLPGSPHGRQQHDRRHGRQDRGRHDQRRALQRHRRGRGASAPSSWTSRNTTRCRCSWRRRPTSSRRTRTRSSPISRPGST